MKMVFEMRLSLECPICEQPITGDEAGKDREEHILVGRVEKPSVCCKCHSPVDKNTQNDVEYLRRWLDEREKQRRNAGPTADEGDR